MPMAHAQTSDALLDKLVDKGYLTVKEANELREQAEWFTSTKAATFVTRARRACS